MNKKKYRTPTYISWEGMHYRCRNLTNPSYNRYGGRGISVSKEWSDFSKFLEDMGEKPEGYSLDRIDNDKDYSKENCRWASVEEQQNNKCNSVYIKFHGFNLTLAQWAKKLNIPVSTIKSRYYRNKNVEKILKEFRSNSFND